MNKKLTMRITDDSIPPLSDCKERANENHRLVEHSGRCTLEHARRAGQALIHSKAHMRSNAKCRWTLYLKENFDGSLESARAYMRVARFWDDPEVVAARNSPDFQDSINAILKVIRRGKTKPPRPKLYESPNEEESRLLRKMISGELQQRLKSLSYFEIVGLKDCGVDACWEKFCEELTRLRKMHREGLWPPMELSVLDVPVESLADRREPFRVAMEKGTRFGVGCEHKPKQSHDVMDADWSVSRITRERKDTAWKQLGTSGSGNHFVEFGVLTLAERDGELGLAAGEYVALLSHSGSRGAGAAVCSTYSAIAQSRLPSELKALGRLAWLDLKSEAGQEYWAAMNLMGEYAAANHAVIHRLVSHLLGAEIIAGVENHHNFAWIEQHGGRDVVVHRKGATPAGAGVLGVIPGSMADPAFVVRGRGNAESLDSASHGAGRQMSRTKANDMFRFSQVRKELAERGIEVLSAGSDEVPGVYKNIRNVMAAQQDLVEIVAQFDPKIVKMCGDGSRAED